MRLLEIDTTDDRLFVLTRWDLGTDPLEVLDALTAAGLPAASVSRQETVIDSITTGSVGRSLRSVAVVAMASTTFCDSGSTTSPKMVCLPVQVRRLADGDEELGAVGARPGVGHRQQVGLVELQLRVELVVELVARARRGRFRSGRRPGS